MFDINKLNLTSNGKIEHFLDPFDSRLSWPFLLPDPKEFPEFYSDKDNGAFRSNNGLNKVNTTVKNFTLFGSSQDVKWVNHKAKESFTGIHREVIKKSVQYTFFKDGKPSSDNPYQVLNFGVRGQSTNIQYYTNYKLFDDLYASLAIVNKKAIAVTSILGFTNPPREILDWCKENAIDFLKLTPEDRIFLRMKWGI